jgi:sortase A
VAHVALVLGRALIAIGVLLLLFVGYELWGTNLNEASAQKTLEHRYEQLRQSVGASSTTTPTTGTTTPDTDNSTLNLPNGKPAASNGPAPKIGDPIGVIKIPKIHVDKTMVEGVSDAELRRGPGHYPSTPLPGQRGNAGIAGHRTTYGAPFADIDQLEAGDDIVVETVQGTFYYKVMGDPLIVAPTDVQVLDDFGDNRLTLTACHPRYSAAKRIIVQAKLVGPPVQPLAGQHQGQAMRFHIDIGWGQYLPMIRWGLLCAAIWAVTWAASRELDRRFALGWRRWAPYVAGVPVFLLALWAFFGQVSTLLPSNF